MTPRTAGGEARATTPSSSARGTAERWSPPASQPPASASASSSAGPPTPRIVPAHARRRSSTPCGCRRKARLGLFDVKELDGVDVLTASGLGGGSLIGSGVMMRPDDAVLAADGDGAGPQWPVTSAELKPHFDAAEAALGGPAIPVRAQALRRHTAPGRDAVRFEEPGARG